MLDLRNLDDVERYVKENMPNWKMKRGQLGGMRVEAGEAAADYEVIRLYAPTDDYCIDCIAEFWRGYYSTSPNSYTGIYQVVCKGDLNSAMRSVLQEKRGF